MSGPDRNSLLASLRESLKPLECILAVTVLSGNRENLMAITETLAGLLAHARELMEARQEHHGNVH